MNKIKNKFLLTVSNRFNLLQSDSNIETREMQQYEYDIRRTIFAQIFRTWLNSQVLHTFA